MKKQYTEREFFAQLKDPVIQGAVASLDPDFVLHSKIQALPHYTFRMFITILCLAHNKLFIELYSQDIMRICNSQQAVTTKKALMDLHNLNLISVVREVKAGYELGKKSPLKITPIDPKDYLKDRPDLLTMEGF